MMYVKVDLQREGVTPENISSIGKGSDHRTSLGSGEVS